MHHRLAVPALALTLALTACSGPAQETRDGRVLVFTRTEGYRHASIEVGLEALRDLGRTRAFSVEQTSEPEAFSERRLAGFDAVVFLNTTGDVLDNAQQDAFQTYVEGGGGYVGVHSAADTEYDWPWYGRLVGAYFESHPEIQEATVEVARGNAAATRDLPSPWVRADEWYNYRALPQGVAVLLRLDETSYEGGTMGAAHPIAWSHTVGEGRAFYTGLGHTAESYADDAFRSHLAGAVCWAARLACAR